MNILLPLGSVGRKWLTKVVRFLVQEGDNMVEASVSDLIEEGITLNPVCLVYSSIDEDNWENEPSDWIEPKGMFNEKTFSFQFPWDHVNSLGYTQIRVTYTLNE